MSLMIDVIVEEDFLRLRCSGHCSLADVTKVYSQVVSAALEHDRSRVLIDAILVDGELTTMERYASSEFIASDIRQRALGKITRIAVCGREPLIDPQRFGETVAVNRGVNAKASTDVNEAVAWLRQ